MTKFSKFVLSVMHTISLLAAGAALANGQLVALALLMVVSIIFAIAEDAI